jgi:hypothetical protein
MMPDQITPETPVNAKASPNKKAEAQQGFLGKYKWYIVGGAAVIAILVFLFVSKSNANSSGSSASTADQASQSGIDPATGYLYGSQADLAALGELNDSGSSGGTTPSTTTNNYYSTGSSSTSTGSSSTSSTEYYTALSNGKWSLNQLAAARSTTVSALIADARASLTGAALQNFNAYVAKGTSTKMPNNLAVALTNSSVGGGGLQK